MRLKALLLLPALLAALPSLAQEFSYTYEGQTINYSVIDEATKTVVAVGSNQYVSGNLILPEHPMDGTTRYTLTEIGGGAFFYSGLTKVTIPNSVTSIGGGAFLGCYGLTSVTIPNSVTSIGDSAFGDCSGLTEVTIGNSVTSIGYSAFANCYALKEVTIPNSVIEISMDAFFVCTALTAINVDTRNPNYSSVDGVLFNKDATVLLVCPCGKTGEYIIPNSVTEIGGSAFYNCSGLTEVIIPNSVTEIGESAFEFSGLTSVTIPNSVTSISKNTFSYCRGLTSVTIPSSVTSIGFGAFASCSGLTEIVIPNYVTSIDESAFAYCNGLTEVTIPSSVTKISDNAFRSCSSLTSVTMPNSVTSIGWAAFVSCTSLTEVIIPPSVETISSYAFGSCSNLATIKMGSKVKSIGEYAFQSCPATKIYITAQKPPESSYYSFTNYSGKLYVQGEGTEAAYRSASSLTCWSNFSSIETMAEPTALTVNKTTISAEPGESVQLSATMEPENVPIPNVFWRSTDTSVATVDHTGLVTITDGNSGISRADIPGTCKIIAESLYADGPIAEVTVKQLATGIETICSDRTDADASPDGDGTVEVYNLNGLKVASATEGLTPGFYIIRRGGAVKKIAIK